MKTVYLWVIVDNSAGAAFRDGHQAVHADLTFTSKAVPVWHGYDPDLVSISHRIKEYERVGQTCQLVPIQVPDNFVPDDCIPENY